MVHQMVSEEKFLFLVDFLRSFQSDIFLLGVISKEYFYKTKEMSGALLELVPDVSLSEQLS